MKFKGKFKTWLTFWVCLGFIGTGIFMARSYYIDTKIINESPEIYVFVKTLHCRNSTGYAVCKYNNQTQWIQIDKQECEFLREGTEARLYHLEEYESRYLFVEPKKRILYFSIIVFSIGLITLVVWLYW